MTALLNRFCYSYFLMIKKSRYIQRGKITCVCVCVISFPLLNQLGTLYILVFFHLCFLEIKLCQNSSQVFLV